MMAVARYRERWTVARSKRDHTDAMVLANILHTDRHAAAASATSTGRTSHFPD